MDCPSEFALLKHNGEVSTADDPRLILGVTVDKVANRIIVTYQHIVQQIKLLKESPWTEEHVQWRTKYRLTSAVVYEGHSDSYVAVCGGDTVRVAKDFKQLDNADKHTFRIPITKVLIRANKTPLILFCNGDCLTLSHGLEHCKIFNRRAPIKGSFIIVEAISYTTNDTDYVCFTMKDKNNSYSVINYAIKDEMCDYRTLKIARASELRDCEKTKASVKGCCIIGSASSNPSICFTWSDAYIGMYDVVKNSWKLKFYPLLIQRQYESTLVCLKSNIIFFYGKYDNNRHYPSNEVNFSFTLTIHKSLPKWWSYMYVLQKPYCKDATAYDCDDHVVLVEPSRITVWSVTVTNFERHICYLNDSEALFRHLEAKDFLPVFGNPKKYNHAQPLHSFRISP